MTALALGLIGIILGAVGSELLRAANPELVKKIEDSAKRFAEGHPLYESGEEESTDRE